MEVSHGNEPRVRRGLFVMGLATTAIVCAAMVLPRLVQLFLARSSDSSEWDLPYNGWQVDVAEGAIALAITVTILTSALLLKRRWSGLRGRTPYLRVPILIALLPSIALGDLARGPVTHVVAWASTQTSAAKQAQAEWERQRAGWQRSPTIRTSARPARVSLSRLLLGPEDLGAGWYDGESPNPAARERVLGQKAVEGARAVLVRTHREGLGWAVANPLLFEQVTVNATPGDAAALARRRSVPPGMRDEVLMVHGVKVLERVTPLANENESASFAIGRFTFTVSSDGMPGSSFDSLVDAAVRKALHPR